MRVRSRVVGKTVREERDVQSVAVHARRSVPAEAQLLQVLLNQELCSELRASMALGLTLT